MWYVRETSWKLNQAGELFDMSHSPFEEKLVPADTEGPEAKAARKRLQAALNQLNPADGILDDGDGTGRHANRSKKATVPKRCLLPPSLRTSPSQMAGGKLALV